MEPTRNDSRRSLAWRPAAVLLVLGFVPPAAVAADPGETLPEPPRNAPLPVTVDPRIELFSIIFRLAGNPEYCQGRVPGYVADVDSHFAAHRDHPVVRLARELRRDRGIAFDAPMSLAAHATGIEALGEAVPFDRQPWGVDSRWRPEDARRFLAEARKFVKDASFARFLEDHDALYRGAIRRMETVAAEARLEWFESFFGARPEARFHLVLGMLNGGACYGSAVRGNGGEEDLYCILGVWATDADGAPTFDEGMLGTVAHEFCHAFAGPIVQRNEEKLRKPGETLFRLTEKTMRRQAYGTWLTMMNESMVRACVVRYLRATRGESVAEAEVQDQHRRGFSWCGELSRILGEYEAERERYPTLEAFFPRVVSFFEERLPAFVAALEAKAAAIPKVLTLSPEDGAKGVDPGLDAIRIEFDRPMRPSYSVVGGGPNFPELRGTPSWDAGKKVFTVPVKLKPDWSYEFGLNSERFQGFASAGGVALEPMEVRFRTGAAR